jgi:DNA-binding FrmR family transcriptional regulator
MEIDCMGHTVRDKTKLLARVRRIRGQVEALERALEAEKGCSEVLQQIAAVRGAMNGLMTEVLEDHVLTHIASPSITSNAERAKGADELLDVIRAYLK